jgi:hypothetical protein
MGRLCVYLALGEACMLQAALQGLILTRAFVRAVEFAVADARQVSAPRALAAQVQIRICSIRDCRAVTTRSDAFSEATAAALSQLLLPPLQRVFGSWNYETSSTAAELHPPSKRLMSERGCQYRL